MSATRNLGLLRCESDQVQNLDDDAVLVDRDSMGALIEPLRTERVAFSFGGVRRWEDGVAGESWSPPPWPGGRIESGTIPRS